ncbi:hypothetical protein AMS68_002054 [Peltaster fructicola]|uniref:Vacuolar protein 14 C-terminal Fig4-binding domain-containing protein n=1 Tax=Peltaster fructicola TaxID=286661 RepID=A0A6H0XP51_9PEZI|nr:hypothetical protein AMS68_002054 [Peltaster fructicola]
MYNIAKVAKGEILLYFNDVFDALCRLSADTELSVKNGAELLDRLVKDIVSESAATYASIVLPEDDSGVRDELNVAFSLPKFIPLLQERIQVINPFTRTFLVSWITLLDSIPDLELVAFLPSFLGGLLRFLTDPNTDVHTTTKVVLDRFLSEIRKIAAVKKGIAQSRKSRDEFAARRASVSTSASAGHTDIPTDSPAAEDQADGEDGSGQAWSVTAADDEKQGIDDPEDEWIPGQDVKIEYRQILDILVTYLSESTQEEIQTTTLRWIETFLSISPEDILVFTPRLLAHILPALSHEVDHVKQAAARVNAALMEYVMSLPEEPVTSNGAIEQPQQSSQLPVSISRKDPNTTAIKPPKTPEPPGASSEQDDTQLQGPYSLDFDYEAAVNSLTLQFLHEHEATRVAALAWLINLHRKSPRKILADGTFPALLKTLSDPSEAVVVRDLLLLSQISKNSEESYFTSFMVNLLKLFCTDRRLLETRGNLIIRQLCLTLSAERIYRTMADILEKEEEDIEFASIMVQNLNNNLITAPELADLRKRLRNLDTRDGQTFFTVLFRAWCVNAVATFSLCLLSQAYEQAYNLLQIFADIEMTVTMLIQIDKLVQLLESPVFTYLRMQLLEPERHPFLYKCMYGVLMLLPQSSAFAALKNRLNSVAPIGYLHMASSSARASQPNTPSAVSTFERQNRLKAREDSTIRWSELLDKFKVIQERMRRLQQRALGAANGLEDNRPESTSKLARNSADSLLLGRPGSAASYNKATHAQLPGMNASATSMSVESSMTPSQGPPKHKTFAHRLTGVANRAKGKKP